MTKVIIDVHVFIELLMFFSHYFSLKVHLITKTTLEERIKMHTVPSSEKYQYEDIVFALSTTEITHGKISFLGNHNPAAVS